MHSATNNSNIIILVEFCAPITHLASMDIRSAWYVAFIVLSGDVYICDYGLILIGQ